MRYGFDVFQTKVEDHVFWVAKSKDLKGCAGQGETMEKALQELELNESEWLVTAVEVGIPVPDPSIEIANEYSSKFVVRISPFVHREASEQAKKQGISLNQYVNNAIVTMNTASVTADAVKEVVKGMNNRESVSQQKNYYHDNATDFK